MIHSSIAWVNIWSLELVESHIEIVRKSARQDRAGGLGHPEGQESNVEAAQTGDQFLTRGGQIFRLG